MVKVNRRKKDLYWHNIAHQCLEYDFKPAQITKILKEVFPQTSVTGRHIGAYKRRLKQEGILEEGIALDENMDVPTLRDMKEKVKDLVAEQDMFIYNCSVGSHKRSLKCFEYKLTADAEDEIEKIDIWLTKIK
tara:strand:- start:503 stop:901 length:399 start_codon:yes stop_codon:yes gene_type:complete